MDKGEPVASKLELLGEKSLKHLRQPLDVIVLRLLLMHLHSAHSQPISYLDIMDGRDDDVEELNQQYPMHQEDISQILAYLSLPASPTLPLPPLAFLCAYIHVLPPALLRPFSSVTTPRQRSTIRQIKSRRLVYGSSSPPPPDLTASAGRLRWPLLWERMGGAANLPLPSARDEEAWVKDHFLPGTEGRQQVKKLGGFLRGLEEEREMDEMRAAKRAERRLDSVGEEFDEESDEEEEGLPGGVSAAAARPIQGAVGENQEEVKQAFERKLLELFVDGMDVSKYTS